MKILLTGSTGFIGSHLHDLLVNQHELYCLVRNGQKAKKLNLRGQHVIGDLSNTSIDQWIKSLPADLDMIIHTASTLFTFDPAEFYKTNYEANVYLVNKLKERFQKLEFIFISSQAAAGPSLQGLPRKESDSPCPLSHYGKSKLLFEQFLRDQTPEQWMCTILRPPMVIGPRDTGMKQFFEMIKSGMAVLPGKRALSKEYSFISVFDLCHLLLSLMRRSDERRVQVFHLAHPQKISFKDLIVETKKILGKKRVLLLPLPLSLLFLLSTLLQMLSKFKFLTIPQSLNHDKLKELKADSWLLTSEYIDPELYQWDLKKTIESALH